MEPGPRWGWRREWAAAAACEASSSWWAGEPVAGGSSARRPRPYPRHLTRLRAPELGQGCLALSGCVLCVNHHTQMNGLECTAMSPLREKYQQLFCPHVSMRQFMWQNDLPQLARFVIECLQFLAAAQFTG